MSADRIAAAFAARRSQGQMAFIPFVTAGDPDLTTTVAVIRQLDASGADLIEVGFPYSDPIADGPVIQASYTRALGNKVKLKEIFAAVKTVASEVQAPLLAMVSYAIIFRSGVDQFLADAVNAGFTGLIVPDLPGDESSVFAEQAAKAGLAMIQLVAPTTPAARLDRILQHASGFVYCIAVAGTTGAKEALPEDLARMLQQLRTRTQLPLSVGFGLGRPEQITALQGIADGAIVGSALVKFLAPQPDQTFESSRAVQEIGKLATALGAAAHRTT